MIQKVAFHTLGCKLNYSESSAIARDFNLRGFKKVNFNESADVYVINTCTVTENANRDCRKIVKKAIRQSPDAFIAIMGCYAQLKPKELSKIPGVDVVFGIEEKFSIFDYINNFEKRDDVLLCHSEISENNKFHPAFSTQERTRSFLKIQDGCDYKCTFCTIPKARGPSRSQSILQTVKLAKKLISLDNKEIVLSGVNIGDFGKNNKETLLDLIKSIEKLDSKTRFRISSIEPNLLTDEIINFISMSNKFVPHFHIPLQSGSDKILNLMGRRYQRDLYANRIKYIKSKISDCSIGVDVIVGFPGELNSDFLDTMTFLSSLKVSYLHVFPYSERDDTIAANLEGMIPQKERNMRSKQLRNLSNKFQNSFITSQINKVRKVLFESVKDEWVYGLTDNYIRIKVNGNKSIINTIQNIRITDSKDNVAIGEFIN